jgi:hypothetical protein
VWARARLDNGIQVAARQAGDRVRLVARAQLHLVLGNVAVEDFWRGRCSIGHVDVLHLRSGGGQCVMMAIRF